MSDQTAVEPRLRADAQRNLDRILTAAAEVFAEQGMDGSVDEIARRAGVGHATVYRRFPAKEDLVLTFMERHLEHLVADAEAAAGAPDAWAALRGVLEGAAAGQARDRGFFEAVGRHFKGSPRLREPQRRVLAALGHLLRRAQEAGQVRADLEPGDLPFLLCAAGRSVPVPVGPADLWRRYLGVILDGMSLEGGATPLSPRAPTLEELERSSGACARD